MKTFPKWKWAGAVLLAAATATVNAVEVKTLGGGPTQASLARAGFANGHTLTRAKFNQPLGVAVDVDGDLIIADRNNNKLREITFPGDDASSFTRTFATRIPYPAGVAVDGAGLVYAAGQRDVRVFDEAGALLFTYFGFRNSTAVALDANTNVYVALLNGSVWQIAPDGTILPVAEGLNQPRGLAVLDSATLAVSESGRHAIHLVNLLTGERTLLAGGNGAGFADGSVTTARFNSPWGLAAGPSKTLVVADRLNHRVRLIGTNGQVQTLYGGPSSQWLRPFPGWRDGSDTAAQAREPVGVAVGTNGAVYVTEKFWNIVREVTGVDWPTNGGGSGPGPGPDAPVPAPTSSPIAGFFPMGVTITVTSSVPVFYTTDGTEPTTNSRQVQLVNSVGTIRFMENTRDLAALRLKAFFGTNSSVTVGGQPSSVNEIGIPRDFAAGSGSRLVLPVVANLRPGQRVQSYQYRVEITPLNGAPPILPYLDATSISTNDFIQLATPAADGKVAEVRGRTYDLGATRGMVVSASGTNANVDFERFATVSLLMVPIDPAAREGQQYRVEVLFPSATSDGLQSEVPISAMPARTITIRSTPFLVGDVAPGGGYNAGEFGDGDLQNNDANAVLYASVGLRTPIPLSAAFYAMDAYPPDSHDGDGFIDSLDWNVVLQRSLRLDTQNWLRRWIDGGIVISEPTALPVPLAHATVKSAPPPAYGPGLVWLRGAAIGAGNVYNVSPGTCEVPLYVNAAPGFSVGGMGFRVVVEANNGAPGVSGLSFTPFVGQNAFVGLAGAAANDMVCAWMMVPAPAFSLQGSNAIGTLRFNIPAGAAPGQSYTIRVVRPSGGADLRTPVSFESIPGSAWILSGAGRAPEVISDEWRQYFFGGGENPESDALADPDGDGASNAQEFIEGTNPADATSRLRLETAVVETASGPALKLSWLSAPAKVYVVERGAAANGPWAVLEGGIPGDGYTKEFIDTSAPPAPFYRVRVTR